MTFSKTKFRNRASKMAIATFTERADFGQSFIIEEKRDYPHTTIRQEGVGITGKIAQSPRDVVDTGKLRDSYTVTPNMIGSSAGVEVIWDAPHSAKVYAGGGSIPPYPWMHLSEREFDYINSFKNNWNKV